MKTYCISVLDWLCSSEVYRVARSPLAIGGWGACNASWITLCVRESLYKMVLWFPYLENVIIGFHLKTVCWAKFSQTVVKMIVLIQLKCWIQPNNLYLYHFRLQGPFISVQETWQEEAWSSLPVYHGCNPNQTSTYFVITFHLGTSSACLLEGDELWSNISLVRPCQVNLLETILNVDSETVLRALFFICWGCFLCVT